MSILTEFSRLKFLKITNLYQKTFIQSYKNLINRNIKKNKNGVSIKIVLFQILVLFNSIIWQLACP